MPLNEPPETMVVQKDKLKAILDHIDLARRKTPPNGLAYRQLDISVQKLNTLLSGVTIEQVPSGEEQGTPHHVEVFMEMLIQRGDIDMRFMSLEPIGAHPAEAEYVITIRPGNHQGFRDAMAAIVENINTSRGLNRPGGPRLMVMPRVPRSLGNVDDDPFLF